MTARGAGTAPPIAIVGLGAMFPGRGTTAGFWRDILEGVDTVTDVPRTHWLAEDYFDPDPSRPDRTYCARGSFLRPFPFDPVAHGTPPKVVETTDTVQLIALKIAEAVLKEAEAGLVRPIDRERIFVILGVAAGTEMMQDMASRLGRPQWLAGMREHGLSEAEAERIADRITATFGAWRESTFPGLLANVVAGRIANRLDLGGTNFTADAACASSLAAVKHAIAELHEGDADLVITGGADALNAIFMYMCFSKTPAMSASGVCRPFSEDADGTLMGEGAALFALRRLEDAERDGNAIHAVIRGIGAASDGRATSVYAPRSSGQARAIRRALAKAGASPRSIGLVEAHGTGTRAGDRAELDGLREAFGDAKGPPWCALGSVKSQIGHTKSAAGAASLAKCALALRHRVLPPTINVTRPDARLGRAGSPFWLGTEARPWIAAAGAPRRASLSSFGFGGSNYHAVLEEYRGPGRRPPGMRAVPAELFLFSAADHGAARAAALAAASALRDEEDMAAAARDSQRAFDRTAAVRVAIVAGSPDALSERGGAIGASGPAPPGLVVVTERDAAGSAGRLAYLFAGQGSQYVGMGADLAIHFDRVRAMWDRFAAVSAADGEPLHRLVFPPTAFDEETRSRQAERLTDTANAQPALAVLSLAQSALLARLGLAPDAVGGHSFGEVLALAEAGALDAGAAVDLARARGAAMGEAAARGGRRGGMIAAFAGREEVEALLGATPVVVANDNGPRQVVLAGALEALSAAEASLVAAGVAVRRLPVSTAFHSPLVEAAVSVFRARIDESALRAPRIPVYANATAGAYPSDPAGMADLLAGQLARPVLFQAMVEEMYADGVRTFVEVGPSGTLTPLVAGILGTRPHHAVAIDRRGRHGVVQLLEAVGTLAALGHPLDLSALFEDAPPAERRLDPKPHELILTGANYNKPYPPAASCRSAGGAGPAGGTDGAAPAVAATTERERRQGAEPTPASGPPPRPEPLAAPARGETGTAATTAAPLPHDRPAVDGAPAGRPPMRPPTTGRVPMRPPMAGEGLRSERARHAPTSPPPTRDKPGSRSAMAEDKDTAAILIAEMMAREHGRFLETLAEAHREFLGALERTAAVGQAHPLPLPSRSVTADPTAPAPPAAPAVPPSTTPAAASFAPAAIASASPAPTARPAEPVAPEPPAAAAMEGAEALLEIVRDVVARETGYPAEMLEPQMDLEADLGIDSIKQVEILSALRDALPGLPDIDPARLAEIRTLGGIAEALAIAPLPPRPSPAGATAAPQEPLVPAGSGPATAPEPAVHVRGNDLLEIVRDVVARETGYPAEMLEPQMDLEADLGIDSIKQVEILSALRDALPGLPDIDPAGLAEIRTLGGIAEALAAGSLPAAGSAHSGEAPDPSPPLQPAAGDAAPAAARRAEPERPSLVPPAVPDAALLRMMVREAVRPAEGTPEPGRWGRRAEVTAEARGLADALARRLAADGLEAQVVEEPSGHAPVVISTAGLCADLDAFGVQARALAAARAAAPRLAGEGGLLVLLGDGRRPGTVADAARCGLPGLARTAALEWPGATVRAVEVDPAGAGPDALAGRIADEAFLPEADIAIRLAPDGSRVAEEHVEVAPDAAEPLALPDGAFVVASGGGRGITADCLVRLAGAARIRLLLLGRTEPVDWPDGIDPALDEKALRAALARQAESAGHPAGLGEITVAAARLSAARDIRRTLAAVAATGSEVAYEPVDVADRAAVHAAVDRWRTCWGPLAGIVHGAGVLADRLIRDKTEAELARVFAPKVEGLASLLAAAKDDSLAFLALFSSVAARYGNPGQADYAMANAAAERMAAAFAAAQPDARVRTIAWGPWNGGMVDETLAARFEASGVGLVPRTLGADAFVAELLAGGPGARSVVIRAAGARAGRPAVGASAGGLARAPL